MKILVRGFPRARADNPEFESSAPVKNAILGHRPPRPESANLHLPSSIVFLMSAVLMVLLLKDIVVVGRRSPGLLTKELLGVRISGTLGDIDPLNRAPFKESQK